jgi:hypothetical protein
MEIPPLEGHHAFVGGGAYLAQPSHAFSCHAFPWPHWPSASVLWLPSGFGPSPLGPLGPEAENFETGRGSTQRLERKGEQKKKEILEERKMKLKQGSYLG